MSDETVACEGGAGPISESELESECELEEEESSCFSLPLIWVCFLPDGVNNLDFELSGDPSSSAGGGIAGPTNRVLFEGLSTLSLDV